MHRYTHTPYRARTRALERAQTELGRGVLGVVDGASPLGVETEADIAWRKDLLRKIGYKL